MEFYFDDILTGSISRIEVLKGNQSTIYGSGAMGGGQLTFIPGLWRF